MADFVYKPPRPPACPTDHSTREMVQSDFVLKTRSGFSKNENYLYFDWAKISVYRNCGEDIEYLSEYRIYVSQSAPVSVYLDNFRQIIQVRS